MGNKLRIVDNVKKATLNFLEKKFNVAFGQDIPVDPPDFGILEFNCIQCNSIQKIDIIHHKYKSRTTIKYIKSESILNDLLIKNKLYPDYFEDGKLFGLLINKKNPYSISSLLYNKCKFCNSKYLTFYNIEGDFPSAKTSIYYIWKIEVDEEYFLKFFHERL
ncbi:hypothetical protein GCM10027275_27020 [Rhabdobacter roseus]|uniref:Uncharacterized protein n=1 Tax=Rhabdobacter roseus TaxID=1655419 RepID=A0A840TWR2_9BACT|nr:hypothetical protein [Rhabdobacter roseus]MBB5284648.1 hypothetical protein [Rhabdobacter roseus]